MVKGRIIIKANPFEEILRSARETLNVECSGSLFGEILEKRASKIWIAEAAHAYQLTKRYPRGLNPEKGAERADWSLLHDTIGEYHLHTVSRQQIDGIRTTESGRAIPSEQDKNNLREAQGKFEIITSLKRVKTTRKLEYNPYLVAGYIQIEGKTYKVEMSGYYCNGRIYRAELEVPKKVLKLIR